MDNIKFKGLSDNELEQVNGGALAGVLLGAANGYCFGMACAFVGSLVTPNWTWQDTKNMMNTGTVVGAYLGAFLPV